MPNRDTKSITLPQSKLVVTYYEWVSAREMFSIIQAEDVNETAIKKMVVTVTNPNGKELEKVKALMDDISVQDFKVLDKELNKLFPKASEPETEKKKTA